MRDLVRQIVEGYKSLRLEGQGEGYVLFSGREPDSQQPVWIKILPRLLGKDPQIAIRFRGLALTIRQLNHPNIAAIQKVGEKAGLPYIVTRAIEKAQPLAAKLDQPWAVDAAADLVMQVGQALEHAHNKGLVHGSLAPENIVVRDDGQVLVTDFGLSELLDLVGVQLRQAASPFLAPERRVGKPADARADVYSLAAILYSLLTKRAPQVAKGRVLPPSRFNPDVPEAMDKVLVRGLAADSKDRYPDAASFLAALGAVTLAPAAERIRAAATGQRCPHCGAEGQKGRFCRKCGARLEPPGARAPRPLAQSKLDEPIQVTKVKVGRIEMGTGVDVHETVIAQPMSVTTRDMAELFPEPLEMPQMNAQGLWPTLGDQLAIAMPEPPPMPVVDWAEIAPPMPKVPTIEDVQAPVSTEED